MNLEKEEVKKIFQKFVAISDLRISLRTPFKKDGYFVATNGHRLISIPEDYMNLGYDLALKPPQRLKTLIECTGGTEYQILSKDLMVFIEKNALMVPESEECFECGGVGGNECDLGHEHECEECNGSGKMILNDPKSIKDEQTIFEIHGVWYSYMELKNLILSIDSLGVGSFSLINHENLKAGIVRMFPFTFLIMPCRKITGADNEHVSNAKFQNNVYA
jgi:hypothetical protein